MVAEAQFWNELAEKYSRKPVDDPDAFERKIEITKSRMSPQSVVLDIGCGTGTLALRLAPSCAHVHAVDMSSEMIRIARGKAEAQHIDNVTFHVGALDEAWTKFDIASLDGICAYSLLHLVEDRLAALAAIQRLLKPGGFFISSTLCLAESRVPYGPILRFMRWLGKAPSVKIISKQTFEHELRHSGFVDVSLPDVGAKPLIAFTVATKPRTA